MSNISYSAVVLDEKSKQRLLNRFKSIIPNNFDSIPNYLKINDGEIDPEFRKYLGMTIRLDAVSIASNENIIVLGINNFKLNSNKPYIVLAANSTNNSLRSVDNLTNWKPLKRPIIISGKVSEIEFKFNN
jgi:hypothetical protein